MEDKSDSDIALRKIIRVCKERDLYYNFMGQKDENGNFAHYITISKIGAKKPLIDVKRYLSCDCLEEAIKALEKLPKMNMALGKEGTISMRVTSRVSTKSN